MTPEEARLNLHVAGYSPIPCHGKIPVLEKWQRHVETNAGEIELWATLFPEARNTGILTRLTPTLDIDITLEPTAEAVEALVRERFEERGYILVRFGRKPKRAVLFRTNEPFAKISEVLIAPDGSEQRLEFLALDQQVVVHGVHPDTREPYSWYGGEPGPILPEDLPYISAEEAAVLLQEGARLLVEEHGYSRKPTRNSRPRRDAAGLGDGIGKADWSYFFANAIEHEALCAFAMTLLRSGMSDGAAVNLLRDAVHSVPGEVDEERRRRRLQEIPGMVSSAREKLEAKNLPTAPPPRPTKLDEVVSVFRAWLLLEDPGPVYVTLGAIAANHLPGPPVWLGLIAPPSSAKTEILNATLRLAHMVLMTTASPAALLSGTPKKQMAGSAKGGLLREIGAFGILVLKDFTSVLGLQRDNLSAMLDALREIYDGKWVRTLGTDGGKTLKWEGKLGLIFGCTEAYDSHYGIIGALGDRFVLYRLPPAQYDQFEMALKHTGERFKQMQDELADAVAGLFAGLSNPLPTPPPLSIAESLRLKKNVILACLLRGGVDRDRVSREIEAVYGAEGAGRLALALERLLAGLCSIGVERQTALEIVDKVALDSVPPIRRKAYAALASGTQKTREIATTLGLPTTTVRRALEELTAHGLATRKRTQNKQGKDGRDDEWTRVELHISAAPISPP